MPNYGLFSIGCLCSASVILFVYYGIRLETADITNFRPTPRVDLTSWQFALIGEKLQNVTEEKFHKTAISKNSKKQSKTLANTGERRKFSRSARNYNYDCKAIIEGDLFEIRKAERQIGVKMMSAHAGQGWCIRVDLGQVWFSKG